MWATQARVGPEVGFFVSLEKVCGPCSGLGPTAGSFRWLEDCVDQNHKYDYGPISDSVSHRATGRNLIFKNIYSSLRKTTNKTNKTLITGPQNPNYGPQNFNC